MSKKGLKFGIASAAVIGAGAAVLRAKNKSEAKKAAETTTVTSEPKNDYRNTERGKDKKNSKGIYYTNGNYEAFARPEKPEGVDEKSAYLVGSGLAALAAACFLVRDGQMKGDHIHILEAMDIAGGACDGIYDPTRGYIMRGGREMENHFECLWDLFHSIPSIETPGVSVLEVFLHRKNQGFILVVLREFQCGEVRQSADVVNEPLEVQLHLQCTMPVFECEHRSPVQPEGGIEDFIIENILDRLVVQILVSCHEEFHDLHAADRKSTRLNSSHIL